METVFASALLLSLGLSSAAGAAPVTVRFDGAEASVASREFAYRGAQFAGGEIATEGSPGLYSSGAFYYDVSDDGGEITFANPAGNVKFFYVHGFGHEAGTARAFDANGGLVASAESRKASYFSAPDNFVVFETSAPIEKITFDGGLIDDFTFSATSADFTPSTALNGAWINTTPAPFLDGQGLLLEYMPENRVLFVAWFTYDGTPPTTRQRWLTAQGETTGATASLSIVETSGGAFNAASSVQRATIGTMSVAFTSCDAGTITFAIPGESKTGTFAIRRLRSVLAGDGSCSRSN